jgi:hypothetical protein
MPRSIAALSEAIVLLVVSETGAAFLITADTEGGTLADGWGNDASACTVLVVNIITTKASASVEAPANSQIRSGAFRPREPDLRRITI